MASFRYPEWRKELDNAREKYMLANFRACRDHGVPRKGYTATTTNGLTTCVMDWLKYHDCYANRINTMGVQRRDKNGQMKWTKSATRKGTADIDAIVAGRPVKIEIKVGKDKMSDSQRAERSRVHAVGGVYIVVANMTEFIAWFQQFTENIYS